MPKSTETTIEESKLFEKYFSSAMRDAIFWSDEKAVPGQSMNIDYLHNGIEFAYEGKRYKVTVEQIKPRKKNGH